MAWGRVKSEHAGPKRGKGYWGRKADAKQASKRSRRRDDHAAVANGIIEEPVRSESERPSSPLR